jgi:ABC-type amino acid transport system permease subunit
LVNQLVDIIKDSSIVAVIGASDLMYTTIRLVSTTNRPFELYTAVGVIYLAIVLIVSHLATRLERIQRRSVYSS